MTTRDQNAIDALCALEIPRDNGGNVGVSCGMYSRLTPDRARGILDAILAGKVPGIYATEPGMDSVVQHARNLLDEIADLRAERDEALHWKALAIQQNAEARAERDTALAKVREVEKELSKHVK